MIITIALGIVLGLVLWRLLPTLLWLVALTVALTVAITVVTQLLSDHSAVIGIFAVVVSWSVLFILAIRRLIKMLFERFPRFADLVNPPGANYSMAGYSAALVFALGIALAGTTCILALLVLTGAVLGT